MGKGADDTEDRGKGADDTERLGRRGLMPLRGSLPWLGGRRRGG